MRGGKKTRLQFDFTPEQVDRIERIGERLEAASRAEVVRRALRVLERLTDETEAGRRIVLRGDDGDDEVLLL